ncbi:hypothetical protein RhiLY_11320 [Ceratobasidium sp. AG-Ba]|nr:hypothetical protein RhiLY_11320 [Ceratobasidium sp. AG-Ba]
MSQPQSVQDLHNIISEYLELFSEDTELNESHWDELDREIKNSPELQSLVPQLENSIREPGDLQLNSAAKLVNIRLPESMFVVEHGTEPQNINPGIATIVGPLHGTQRFWMRRAAGFAIVTIWNEQGPTLYGVALFTVCNKIPPYVRPVRAW